MFTQLCTPRISPHSFERNKLSKNDWRYYISSAFFDRWNLEGEKSKEGRTGPLILESRQPKFDSLVAAPLPAASEFRMNGGASGPILYPRVEMAYHSDSAFDRRQCPLDMRRSATVNECFTCLEMSYFFVRQNRTTCLAYFRVSFHSPQVSKALSVPKSFSAAMN